MRIRSYTLLSLKLRCLTNNKQCGDNTKSVNIRVANSNDAKAIAKVHIAAWRAAYQEYMPQDYLQNLCLDERSKMWESALSEDSPGTTLIVQHKTTDLITGFCTYGPSRDKDSDNNTVCELISINVHPDHWQQGYGTLLCTKLLETASQQNYTSITLWVIKQNLKARQFYEKLNFYCEGTETVDTDLVGFPIDGIRYKIDL